MAQKMNLQRESTAFRFFKSSDIFLAAALVLFGLLFQLFETEIIGPESFKRLWPTLSGCFERVLEALRELFN
jgi:hypothetical protein